MSLDVKYKQYYRELFRVHSGELFHYGVGDNYDEYGDDYSERYESELDSFANDFSTLFSGLKSIGIGMDKGLVLLKLNEYLYILLKKEEQRGMVMPKIYLDGLCRLSKLMVHSDEMKVGMNSVDHPLK